MPRPVSAPRPSDPQRCPARPRLLDALEQRYLLEGFHRLLPAGPGVEPHLRGVLQDALRHPGSLVRAQLAYGILRRREVAAEAARAVAVAIEYFHTSSLLFDDLPSMDDAEERRGHPCPHLVHGEAAATLGALALITRAYALLWQVIGELPPARRRRAADLVAACLGVDGILNGQAHDLYFAGGGERRVLAVAEGKTVSLIRLTLLLPAIVAGLGAVERRRLDRLATVWGLSYQILDDFKDHLMSAEETGKSTLRDGALGRPNLPHALGTEQALEKLEALLAEGRELLTRLAAGERWSQLESLQELLEDERGKVRQRLPLAACA